MKTDYYSILGVGYRATGAEIRVAYRSAARAYHPDINHSVCATEMMQLVNEAYMTLGNARSRASYDREYKIHSCLMAARERKVYCYKRYG